MVETSFAQNQQLPRVVALARTFVGSENAFETLLEPDFQLELLVEADRFVGLEWLEWRPRFRGDRDLDGENGFSSSSLPCDCSVTVGKRFSRSF